MPRAAERAGKAPSALQIGGSSWRLLRFTEQGLSNNEEEQQSRSPSQGVEDSSGKQVIQQVM